MRADQINSYLHRISFQEDLSPSLAVLQRLQRAHLLTVPFENLDIHTGVPIILEEERLFDKVITNRRGGFCYELNGLFFALLDHLGFDVIRVAARVYDKERGYGRPYDHMAILATIGDDRFLVDVGYGEFASAPLAMTTDVQQQDERGIFVITSEADELLLVSKLGKDGPIPEYLFDDRHHQLEEYAEMCHYHQTDPASHFTRNRLISQATANGRITLTDETFKVRNGKSTEEQPVQDSEEFDRLLHAHFDIRITP